MGGGKDFLWCGGYMKEKITMPAVLTAQEKQQYQKPEFQVIPLNMESPLLAGSNDPTSINPIPRQQD